MSLLAVAVIETIDAVPMNALYAYKFLRFSHEWLLPVLLIRLWRQLSSLCLPLMAT
jgi:hypothetical protein